MLDIFSLIKKFKGMGGGNAKSSGAGIGADQWQQIGLQAAQPYIASSAGAGVSGLAGGAAGGAATGAAGSGTAAAGSAGGSSAAQGAEQAPAASGGMGAAGGAMMALGAIGAGMKDAGMSGVYWAQEQSPLKTPDFSQSQNALYSPQQVDSVAKNNQGMGSGQNIINLLKGLGMWGGAICPSW